MPILTIPQIESAWQAGGGSAMTAPMAAAFALAESGGNTDAVSPSNDYGEWQINSIHFPGGSPYVVNWQDPNVNARYAVQISGNGSDWGAWCTAYSDGQCHGIHPLPAPQPGSPAANKWAVVQAYFGWVNSETPMAPPASGRDITRVWGDLQNLFSHVLPSYHGAIQDVFNRAQGMG